MDLTIAEIIAQIPVDDPVRDWWDDASAMPADTTVSEFFLKTLKAASDAQRVKNANLSAGSRIDGYPAPTFGAITIDASTNLQTYLMTCSVRARVATNLDVAVSPLV
ncbi:hypothetical protein PI95_031750 [Hassallia byssoidea VB512170]|uniref:Uncharacterized protein n=1 Tax=Hassallia byssoidea VB512170 TaxID=1304833 RepID=A0A846HJA6_9CYAN|nr:hypothetical protein [Hassalia byssoidea]NEU76949.1 hypothetical protein [Hassalia byssoidea VB512170]